MNQPRLGWKKMQLSDREIQNTLDLLKKKEKMGEGKEAILLSEKEIKGIQEVVKQIDSVPEVRKDKVQKIKKAIESSSYDVTGDDIAKKLVGRMISDKLH
ncbi:MAG: hypothetical protein CVT63_01865 [Candidatus Anoxymicrobium japonicum]|uniref:Anti-sigma-28 factor FlgM C-terminal domain-containing protein n=1 Tax=Candidatus Anoxymicrobium japonicum TaxID=2013648 RepID=A0A2N3G7B4_9ACTN|nr:MAG: hypothetical protein CVT63_01865 [Candidatus Anoxymicrobium japonicum]